MLSKAKHLALSACDQFEILRLRLRMTVRHSLRAEKRKNESGNQLGIVPVVLVALGLLLPAASRRWRINPDTSPSSTAPFSTTIAPRDRLWKAPWPEDSCAAMNTYTQEKEGGKLVDTFPFPVTLAVLARGQQRFNIFCSPCHDRVGTGQGMIVRRGYRAPASFHMDRLRQAPAGYFFDVMTNGFGVMPDYAQQVHPEDRWAIVAYIRALQLSQHATLADVPEDQRQQLEM